MERGLRRDSQQWVLDWVIQKTGGVQHFQGGGRGWLPPSVRQHDMIAKHVGLGALRLETLAREELAAGHAETAAELFYEAAGAYANAQHTVLGGTTEEKRLLHGASLRCFGELTAIAPYPIERVEVPLGDAKAYANLHLLPDRRRAPCVIFIPGCDMTKEMYPHPLYNQAIQRGMHIVSIDGPGQGECAMDGTPLTSDNYERAVSAVIDHLVEREEIDSEAIAVWGLSFSTLWAIQTVACDHRPKVCAAPWASIADLHHLTEMDSPRFKQVLAYMTGATSEPELDGILAGMSLEGRMADVACPTLITVGEFDPRSPLDETVALYDSMTCERELWVFGDQHHVNTISRRVSISERGVWNIDMFSWTLDWIRDRLDDKPIERSGGVTYLGADATTPYGPATRDERRPA